MQDEMKKTANLVSRGIYSAVISTPIGNLGLCVNQDCVTQINFIQDACELFVDGANPLVSCAINELERYFSGQLKHFQTPFLPKGTSFQQKAWQALLSIPYGKTVTYGELAIKLKTSPRAIGNVCRANPVLILIPCHRVLARNGLGGYSGETRGEQLAIKRWLLDFEKSSAVNSSILYAT